MTLLLSMWQLLDRRQQRRFAALQALSVLMALSTVGGIASVLPFLTAMADPQAISRHPLLWLVHEHAHLTDEHAFVTALGIAFAAGVILANLINLMGTLAIDRFAYRVGNALNVALFDEYLHRDYGFHANTPSSLLTINVLHEAGRVTAGILRYGLILVTNLVSIVFIVGSIIFFNPLVAIIAIGGLGMSYTVAYAIARSKLRRNGGIESREYVERTKIVGESFGAIKEIILLQAQNSFVTRFACCCESISATVVSTLSISQIPRYLLECITVSVLVGVALYSSVNSSADAPWIAQLSFMAFAVYRLLPALQQVFSAVVRIRTDQHALENIAADLRRARTRAAASGPTQNGDPWAGRSAPNISLSGISYYPAAASIPAVADMTLDIPAGAFIGLVGANGSGKTTLIDLLSGLLVAQSGHIEIDGILLDEGNRVAWQSRIAYVPQQIFICDCSLAENIALGVPAARIDFDRVRAAVQLAQLEECVDSLPKGYDQVLGESGARLSGGQRQRLGIARALYRDAPVLILDEPTSALDNAAERDIIDMLAAHRDGRTILLVAHRLAALRHCDVVYELAKGQLVRRTQTPQISREVTAV